MRTATLWVIPALSFDTNAYAKILDSHWLIMERLDEGPNDAVISDPTNAGLANDVWTILTGIDFKRAGCWRVIGEYRGQSLEFVVETIDHTD